PIAPLAPVTIAALTPPPARGARRRGARASLASSRTPPSARSSAGARRDPYPTARTAPPHASPAFDPRRPAPGRDPAGRAPGPRRRSRRPLGHGAPRARRRRRRRARARRAGPRKLHLEVVERRPRRRLVDQDAHAGSTFSTTSAMP